MDERKIACLCGQAVLREAWAGVAGATWWLVWAAFRFPLLPHLAADLPHGLRVELEGGRELVCEGDVSVAKTKFEK